MWLVLIANVFRNEIRIDNEVVKTIADTRIEGMGGTEPF